MSMEKLKDSIKLPLSDPRGDIKRPFVTMGMKDQKKASLHKAGTAMPPSFAMQSSISKGQWYNVHR